MDYRSTFEQGIQEFNAGQFFECHDTFEELWMDARGPRKRFLQGMIQSAVGVFHANGGNLAGAYSQLSKGIEKLGAFAPRYHGIDLAAFLDGLEVLRADVRAALEARQTTLSPVRLPEIRYEYDAATVADTD